MSNNAKKTFENTLKHSENTNQTRFEAFQEIFENLILGWKIRFSLQMSNNAKNTMKHPENTNKTYFEAFWEILENPVLGSKIRFSAQISNYAKIPWNTQKTLTKHVLRLFKNVLKLQFSAKKPGSRPKCGIMLKYFENSENTN